MKAFRIIWAVVLVILTGWATSGVAAAEEPRREKLPSGLTVLVR